MIKRGSLLLAGAALSCAGAAVALTGAPSLAAGAAQEPPAARSPETSRCAALAGTKVEAGFVEGAEYFRASEAIVGGTTVGAKAAANLCRVRLRLNPVAGSDIRVEVWLPESWNDKLMGFGGGGFDGSLNPDSGNILNPAIAQGYAAVVSDVGHTPAPLPGDWVHRQPEKVVDFGHRGTHLAAVVAKQVISAYYGKAAKRAYFQGCSNGGRDGLMLVSRYPDDYDAVVAGAPALRYVEIVTQLVTNSRTTATAPTIGAKLTLVHDAIMNKCDALDGVKDGVLENPLLCRFDPGELACKASEGPSCLSAPEVTAFRSIYAGPRLPNGQHIMAPPALGSEGVPGNWGAWVTGPVPGLAGEAFYRWMVHDDPKWTIDRFDLERDYALARERVAPIINVENPDLRAFTRRGGKLLIYQGWDDPAITPGSTVRYYEDVQRRVGRQAATQIRLFMVPGMMHCGGGPGTHKFDLQRVLEDWDRTGRAPETVIASKPDVPKGEPPLTRPLCAWPKVAHYKGKGSTRDAANFSCKATH